MYVPPHFRVNDTNRLHAAMQAVALPVMVTTGPNGMIASHLPLLLDPDLGPNGTLRGHLARANPQANLPEGTETLVIFQGPEGYISPSYYPSKAEHGKVVPTWNYIAVHAYGPIRWLHDAAEKLQLVDDLTRRHEAGRANPWQVTDAPADFIAGMLKGISAFSIEITRLEGKFKLGQNRPEPDRLGATEGLTKDQNVIIAEAMRSELKS